MTALRSRWHSQGQCRSWRPACVAVAAAAEAAAARPSPSVHWRHCHCPSRTRAASVVLGSPRTLSPRCVFRCGCGRALGCAESSAARVCRRRIPRSCCTPGGSLLRRRHRTPESLGCSCRPHGPCCCLLHRRRFPHRSLCTRVRVRKTRHGHGSPGCPWRRCGTWRHHQLLRASAHGPSSKGERRRPGLGPNRRHPWAPCLLELSPCPRFWTCRLGQTRPCPSWRLTTGRSWRDPALLRMGRHLAPCLSQVLRRPSLHLPLLLLPSSSPLALAS